MKSNTSKLLVRNFSHLGIGQVASTALGILLSALLGRTLDPVQFGTLYTAFAILGFVYVLADWGQGTYLLREMARGRLDQPELIGSVLLFRLGAIVLSSGVAVIIARVLGYDNEIVKLTLIALVAWVPLTLYVPLSCSFRSKDRMELDVIAGIVGKLATLIATAVALHLGGGLMEVMLMQGVGNISTLLVGLVAARRLDIAVKAPVVSVFLELLRHGAPIAAFSLVIALQPFVEIALLSAFAGPAVVGWFAASRTLFGAVISPAALLVSAAFPQLSRTSSSLPDFRRTIDVTGRVMFIAAAFSSSALYLFADHMVAIIYGLGRFEETALILRLSAVFIPLLFLGYLLTTAMLTVGLNKAMAVISIVRIALCAALSWLLIDYCQQRFGNGAIALVLVVGVAEIPALISCLVLLPRGAVGSTTVHNLVRACIAALCTVVPLSMLQPLGLLYLGLLFSLLFPLMALVTRLVQPSDLRLLRELARTKLFASEAKSAPDC